MDVDYDDDDYPYDNEELWWCLRCMEYVDITVNLIGMPICPECGQEVQGTF